MVLTEGPAAPADRDEEDEEAGEDEEDGDGEQAVIQEVQILSVGQLGHNPRQDQNEAKDLKIFPCSLGLSDIPSRLRNASESVDGGSGSVLPGPRLRYNILTSHHIHF